MDFPADFLSEIDTLLKEERITLLESLMSEVPISVRINPAKIQQKFSFEPVKWSETGYHLNERPSFTFDPMFHSGCYYPQEASSMFIEQVFKQYVNDGFRVLDLCAAPGGKSTHILSLLGENSLLVSNEVIRSRANILSENIIKSGYPNVVVTNNDPVEIGRLTSFYDVVLVDAPCSGEGMFRKDKNAVNEWSLANVHLCRDRQRRIVADVWASLKPGGLFIYSTCTYNTEENEDNVAWICSEMGAEPLTLDVPAGWNITGALKGNLPVYRFLPHKTKGEGFFMAVLRKSGESEENRRQPKKARNTKEKPIRISDKYRSFICNDSRYTFRKEGDVWVALSENFSDDYTSLKSLLRIVSYGVVIGEEKGKDFVPSHSLAMSNIQNKDLFIAYNVDWNTAISYLRKEAITLPDSVERGYVLISYKNTPLGFVKNIGNRANNLYPQEWRIRSANKPQDFVDFLFVSK